MVDSETESLPHRAVLLVNTKSRRGSEWFEEVRLRLSDGGMELEAALAFRNPRELPRAAARYVKSGTPLVIVGGGDGTFSAIAHIFARQEAILGVLPLGTGNAFARDLGIPVSVEGACDAILNGKRAKVDMGIVGNREFLNVATVGLSTRIADGLDDRSKKILGRGVYLASILKAVATVSPFHVRLELPDSVHEFESLQLVIGNGRFHAGPFPVAPDASITGGWLSIYALASPEKSALLKMAVHILAGGYLKQADVKVFRTQSGKLSTVGPKRVTVDGEVCMMTPIEFGIAPRVLNVAVPQGFEG